MNERVLVLCPKRLRRNWTVYRSNDTLNPFNEDRFRYDVLSHTDLSRDKGEVGHLNLATLNWSNYDLVVIDESHNFRNNKKNSTKPEEKQNKTRYEKLIDDIISSGVTTKVLLLSATPVNNKLQDLQNQISLIAGEDVTYSDKADKSFENKLQLPSIKNTVQKAQREFEKWCKLEIKQRTSENLLLEIGGDFFRMLDGLSIARSRKQIQRYYNEEMEKIGNFPVREKPRSIYAAIDSQQDSFSFEQINEEIEKLTLAIYHPTDYLRKDLNEEIRKSYINTVYLNFTQQGRERILIGMMKINLLKRLESSVHSFGKSLDNISNNIDKRIKEMDTFEKRFGKNNNDAVFEAILPKDFNNPDIQDSEFLIGDKRKFYLGHIDISRWKERLEKDKSQLHYLLKKINHISSERDAKLTELLKIIDEKRNNTTTSNRKLLIFTAFADTAQYLYENVSDHLKQKHSECNIALVCGGDKTKTTFGNNDYDEILTNFSPISKRRKDQVSRFPDQNTEIDVIIATDCISEGQNLQDCDMVINYDIHWNPVRIVQRFGRIDRIGSKNAVVKLVNFWPVKDLEKYLKLQRRVEERMALVDVTATQSDNVLMKPDQNVGQQDLFFAKNN